METTLCRINCAILVLWDLMAFCYIWESFLFVFHFINLLMALAKIFSKRESCIELFRKISQEVIGNTSALLTVRDLFW